MIEAAGTVEQQVGKYSSVSVTYMNIHGEHQFLNRVFPINSGYCSNPTSLTSGYLQCSQSEGVFRQNQINTSIRVSTPKGTNITGFYTANWANSNLSGITDPYHPAYDYGRAGFDIRSQMTLLGTIPLPFLITASPIVNVSSGRPYSITTGQDNNEDGVIDDRPAFAHGPVAPTFQNCTNPANFVSPSPTTSYNPASETYSEIPVNFCTGPNARELQPAAFADVRLRTQDGGCVGGRLSPGRTAAAGWRTWWARVVLVVLAGRPGWWWSVAAAAADVVAVAADLAAAVASVEAVARTPGASTTLSLGLSKVLNLFNEGPYGSPGSAFSRRLTSAR